MKAFWKPWYVHRPWQLMLRAFRSVGPRPPSAVVIRLPWGVAIEIDPGEDIGRAIWTTGVYDLAVSEVLWRLATPGATAVDLGANIGYMTGLLAVRCGPAGRVLAVEPNPLVLPRLRGNVARVTVASGAARVAVHPVAASDRAGTARLACPASFEGNNGVGYLTTELGGGQTEVPTARLDDLVGEPVQVMKVDVEGHEATALRGCERLLAGGQIRHLIFEEHGGPDSETCRLLASHGYTMFQLGWTMRGPTLSEPGRPAVVRPYEAPSYLATISPTDAEAACRPRGWEVLR